ncbi:MAG TPA: SLC13 family permease [Candidatus Limnocylindria bacterium]|nr:SLC13 family permease [Candidatus Limnocylindria bacterium]
MAMALILFPAMYAALLLLPKLRAYIALGTAGLFVVLGILPAGKVFSAVDWNVILMILGTMGIVYLFIESKMPSLMADVLISRMPSVKWVVITLSLFAGIVSAFIDNVATVLMVAPVALMVAKKLGVSPVPAVIAVAVSSNLQGAATLVGDTTSILLGGYANMDFMDFFFYKGRPGLFFIVQAGALVSGLTLLLVFRSMKQKVHMDGRTEVTDLFPTWLMLGTVMLLILASFIPGKPAVTNGLICMGLLVVGILREALRGGGLGATAKRVSREIDWFTLLLLTGLFIVIAGMTEAGVVDKIAQLFVRVSGGSVFMMYSLLVWASVLFSAFIDNIPYVATMLPVTAGIARMMGVDPTILYFGLLVGATLGGNLTPVGASANITGLGILRKAGYEPTTRDFMKISVPFTLAAVLCGYALVWVLYR